MRKVRRQVCASKLISNCLAVLGDSTVPDPTSKKCAVLSMVVTNVLTTLPLLDRHRITFIDQTVSDRITHSAIREIQSSQLAQEML